MSASEAGSLSLAPEVLRRYRSEVFVESGTFLGGALQLAMDLGFQEVHSIERELLLYERACRRFAAQPQVHLYHGDSRDILPAVIAPIQRRVTFWLDGHDCLDNAPRRECPLLEELAIIARHPRRDHTLLIDDLSLMTGGLHGYPVTQAEIRRRVLEINPRYEFSEEWAELDLAQISGLLAELGQAAELPPRLPARRDILACVAFRN
jgi:hypothetical protein